MITRIKKVAKAIKNVVKKIWKFRKPIAVATVAIAATAGWVALELAAKKAGPGLASEGWGWGMGMGDFDIFDERPGKDGSLYYTTKLDKLAPFPVDAPQSLIETVERYLGLKVDA